MRTEAIVPELHRSFDWPIPLDLRIVMPQSDTPCHPPFYWRLIDPKYCLLEVAVDSASGYLIGVTVPMYRGSLKRALGVFGDCPVSEARRGLPVFCLTILQREIVRFGIEARRMSFLDSTGRLTFEASESELRISLASDRVAFRVRTSETLFSEFNADGELTGFVFSNMERGEWNGISTNIQGATSG